MQHQVPVNYSVPRYAAFCLISCGLILFSYFSNINLALSISFLTVSLAIMMYSLYGNHAEDVRRAFGMQRGKRIMIWIFMLAGLAVLAALLYRFYLGETGVPRTLTLFSLTAIFIGAAEEFLFRGFMLTIISRHNPFWAVALCAMMHSTYKVALFLPFFDASLIKLFVYTFGTGWLLGYSRYKSKSIYPCLVFHCLFDFLVYGDMISTPWWVW